MAVLKIYASQSSIDFYPTIFTIGLLVGSSTAFSYFASASEKIFAI